MPTGRSNTGRRAHNRQYKLQCHGKQGHATLDDAAAEIRRAWAHDGTVVPYLCPWCRLYHIGHDPALVKRKKRKARKALKQKRES